METFGMISFALLIYLICTVPTKKDLKTFSRIRKRL